MLQGVYDTPQNEHQYKTHTAQLGEFFPGYSTAYSTMQQAFLARLSHGHVAKLISD